MLDGGAKEPRVEVLQHHNAVDWSAIDNGLARNGWRAHCALTSWTGCEVITLLPTPLATEHVCQHIHAGKTNKVVVVFEFGPIYYRRLGKKWQHAQKPAAQASARSITVCMHGADDLATEVMSF